jgi:hypothetical protein
VGDDGFAFHSRETEKYPDLMGDSHSLIIAEMEMTQREASGGSPRVGGKAARVGKNDLDIFGNSLETRLLQEVQHLSAAAIGRNSIGDGDFFTETADQAAVRILKGAARALGRENPIAAGTEGDPVAEMGEVSPRIPNHFSRKGFPTKATRLLRFDRGGFFSKRG